jgi:omega-amidase
MIFISDEAMTSDLLHIILVQPDIIWQDAAKNRLKYNGMLSSVKVRPDLVILPEMFSTGFCVEPDFVAEEMNGETTQWLKNTATSMQSAVTGSLIIRDQEHFFNRLIFADHQGRTEWYNKRHLFRMAGEETRFTPGTKPLIIHLGDWRISFQICYDLRFPVWSRNRQNYDLLVYVSNWPAARRDVWNTLLRARAIENQCYVAGVNRIGRDGNGIDYIGESMVIDPKGNAITTPVTSSEGLIHAAISLQELLAFRDKFPVWKDWDDFQWQCPPSPPQ